MKPLRFLILSLAMVIAFPLTGLCDSLKIYLKLDGIDGEATAAGHNGDIEVASFKLSVTQRGLNLAGGTASAGASDFKPLTIYKFIDLASPKIFIACASGRLIKTATLVVESTVADQASSPPRPQGPFFKIVLSNVLIANVNEDAATTDQQGNIVETVALSYS